MNGNNMSSKVSNYASMVPLLERQELESSLHGTGSPQMYGQLLAIYLLINDLSNAKLLWKRIPDSIKESNPEIAAVWSVGVKLFKREFSSVYQLVDSFEWPSHLNNIMNGVKVYTRERVLTLLSKAYSSIRVSEVANYLGLSVDETVQTLTNFGWHYNQANGMIIPAKVTPNPEAPPSFEQMMTQLTEYVSILEN